MLRFSQSADGPSQRIDVGQPLQLPPAGSGPWQLHRPDGTVVDIAAGTNDSDATFDRPGHYRLTNENQSLEIVANLAADESVTTPLPVETLESMGVQIGSLPDAERLASELKKLSEVQMEARQRIWKWLILASLVLLIVESALAGRGSTTAPSLEVTAA
jgi:hypothetical protein